MRGTHTTLSRPVPFLPAQPRFPPPPPEDPAAAAGGGEGGTGSAGGGERRSAAGRSRRGWEATPGRELRGPGVPAARGCRAPGSPAGEAALDPCSPSLFANRRRCASPPGFFATVPSGLLRPPTQEVAEGKAAPAAARPPPPQPHTAAGRAPRLGRPQPAPPGTAAAASPQQFSLPGDGFGFYLYDLSVSVCEYTHFSICGQRGGSRRWRTPSLYRGAPRPRFPNAPALGAGTRVPRPRSPKWCFFHKHQPSENLRLPEKALGRSELPCSGAGGSAEPGAAGTPEHRHRREILP